MEGLSVELGIISHAPAENELLERCIQSLIRIPAGVKFNTILQFTPGTYAENWNRLMDRVNADFVCIIEDDTAALKPMWLRSMLRVMMQVRDCAIVMPIETKDGRNPDPGFVRWLDKVMTVQATFGFCNLIRKEAGLRADEALGNYFVDTDLTNQAYEKGWRAVCCGHVWMLHGAEEGRVSSPEQTDLEEKQKSAREYFKKKWKKNKAT
jgi:GT2 family glycosyltransferase